MTVRFSKTALDNFRRDAKWIRDRDALRALRGLRCRLRNMATEIAYLAEIGTALQLRSSDET